MPTLIKCFALPRETITTALHRIARPVGYWEGTNQHGQVIDQVRAL